MTHYPFLCPFRSLFVLLYTRLMTMREMIHQSHDSVLPNIVLQRGVGGYSLLAIPLAASISVPQTLQGERNQ